MEIIQNTIECPFCKSILKPTKDDIKIDRVFSSAGSYHNKVYKRIYCPICNEVVFERFIRCESV